MSESDSEEEKEINKVQRRPQVEKLPTRKDIYNLRRERIRSLQRNLVKNLITEKTHANDTMASNTDADWPTLTTTDKNNKN